MLGAVLSTTLLPRLACRSVRGLGYIASEAHHAHVVAMCLAGRNPVLEVGYDKAWWDEARARKLRNRADVWLPADNSTHQCFVETKLALLYDTSSRRLGDARYGLQRAAPEWAYDLYRLLIGPTGPTHTGFLLFVYSNDGTDLLAGRAVRSPAGTPLAADEVDADQIHDRVAGLANARTSVEAVLALADIVARDLRGRVTHLGGPGAVGAFSADPVLFEWDQLDRQQSAWRE